MLNGKEMVSRGIITHVPLDNVQQHGIDLNLIEVQRLRGCGLIPKEGKTQLPEYVTIDPIDGVWHLHPGVYSITFEQGCRIPKDTMLLIRQRSSLLRNGGILHSSVFDAGFETSYIGTVMVLHHEVKIEVGARIAQIYNHDCLPVENLYNGQWQNDKQRQNESSK